MKNCDICNHHNNFASQQIYEIHRSSLWVLRHHPHPSPLKGWLLLDSKRHLSGPIEFNQAEELSWGKAVSTSSKILKDITKCSRVYLIAFGEGARHLHTHLIPHFEGSDLTKAWNVADYYRNVADNEKLPVDSLDVESFVKEARLIFEHITL